MNKFLCICSAIILPLTILVLFFQWAITNSFEMVVLEENDVEESFVFSATTAKIFPLNKKDEALKVNRFTQNSLKIKEGDIEKVYIKDDFEVFRYLSTNYPKSLERKKVAILYISTGKYIRFWENFYNAMEKYFLPRHEKTYFLFTDHDFLEVANNVVKVHQDQLPWPYVTLKRFHFFNGIKEQLKEFDYIYFLNGTMLPIAEIDEEIFPTEKQEIMVTLHPGAWRKNKFYHTYDRNPKSKAYISEYEGKYYVMGGFNGGTSKGFLTLIDTLKQWTDEDIKNKVMPLWHDESMLNRYLFEYIQGGGNPLILLPEYAIPEIYVGWKVDELVPFVKMWILDKNNYGSHNFLREFKEEESGVMSFVKGIISSKTDENASKLKIPPTSEIIDPLQGMKKVLDF